MRSFFPQHHKLKEILISISGPLPLDTLDFFKIIVIFFKTASSNPYCGNHQHKVPIQSF